MAVTDRARSVLARLALVSLILGAFIAGGLLQPLPASAHSELVSSTPADGTALKAAPATVTLTFSEDIIAAGSRLVAAGPSGPIALGATTVSGPRVSATWPADAPGGAYTVSFRVVSADGHPISGTIRFSYAGAASPTPNPTSSPTETAAPTGTPTTGAGTGSPSAATTSAVASPEVTPAAATGSGGNALSWVVGGVVVVAVVGLAAFLLSRRRT